MTNTKENTVIPPCCQSCVAEGSIDEARLAMAYEHGRDEARKEFKEYLENKLKELQSEDMGLAFASKWGLMEQMCLLDEIINELFPTIETNNTENDE